MKASERCEWHYQGARCRKEKGHAGDHQGVHSEFLRENEPILREPSLDGTDQVFS